MKRTLSADIEECLEKKVRVAGWVDSKRSHGKIIFVDLRDGLGILQLVFSPDCKEFYERAKDIKPEWVIEVIGTVSKRPEGMRNSKIKSGNVEIKVETLKVYSEAKTLPFTIDTDGYEILEEKRLKHRYIDLRRNRMKRNMETRQKTLHFMRNFLTEEGFTEIETPILTKSTPEGARDFLVPARLQPGKFYALPQSPQQYKQLLMISGFEKYFQVAKALRDEDPRADRQAEHTQLDIEMAFVEEEEIMSLVERLYVELVKKVFADKKIAKTPFPRISYKEAMDKCDSDKPDLRKNKKDSNELAFAFITDFPMFEWHEKEKKWGATHHPFTKPRINDIKEIEDSPEKVLASQYDLVLNGYEIAGGSIRTIDPEVLMAVFRTLGHKKEEVERDFKHYFEAFSYGVPPHGGIASGVDRFLSIALNEPNIREVIAFPKTGDNRDLMMEVPDEITNEQLDKLHLKIISKKRK